MAKGSYTVAVSRAILAFKDGEIEGNPNYANTLKLQFLQGVDRKDMRIL